MTPEQIKYMVERFLRWRLPEVFHPDCGISFTPMYNTAPGTPGGPQRHEPTGTNLFGYDQAEAMVRYMIEGLPDGTRTGSPPDSAEGAQRSAAPGAAYSDAEMAELGRILDEQKGVGPSPSPAPEQGVTGREAVIEECLEAVKRSRVERSNCADD